MLMFYDKWNNFHCDARENKQNLKFLTHKLMGSSPRTFMFISIGSFVVDFIGPMYPCRHYEHGMNYQPTVGCAMEYT